MSRMLRSFAIGAFFVVLLAGAAPTGGAQSTGELTPIQREIERQRLRLSSAEVEERRDALMRLRQLKSPEASRVAAGGLNEAQGQVGGGAAPGGGFLPPAEAGRL